MSEVLNDLLEGKVTSNEVVNWITGSGTIRYKCSKDTFISHFLAWLHSHVTHAVQSEPTHHHGNHGYYGNKSRSTPNRKRTDKRRSNGAHYSPGNTSHKGSRTPKSGSKTPQTPFKDSLTSMTDYPPLSSSTPVEDTVSRITNEEEVLIVKRKVDFSRSFSSTNRSQGRDQSACSRDGISGSPPVVRRVALTPAPSKRQMSQLTQHVKETTPFSQDSVSTSSGDVPTSLVTTFDNPSNTDQERGQNVDFQMNITPTKISVNKLSVNGDIKDNKSVFGSTSIFENISGVELTKSGDSEIVMPNKDTDSSALSTSHANKKQIQKDADNKLVSTKSINPPSRKKKIKRVPLMTISNHAKPNWADKSEFPQGKSSSTEKLDVKGLDSRFGDRLKGGPNKIYSKSSGFIEESYNKCSRDSFKELSIPPSDSNASGFGSKGGNAPLTVSKRLTPQKCTVISGTKNSGSEPNPFLQSQTVENGDSSFNISTSENLSCSDNTIPIRRVSLQPVKSKDSQVQENGFTTSFNTTNTSCPSTCFGSTATAGKVSSVVTDRRVTLTPAKSSDNSLTQNSGLATNTNCPDPCFRVIPISSANISKGGSVLPVRRVSLTPSKTSDNSLIQNSSLATSLTNTNTSCPAPCLRANPVSNSNTTKGGAVLSIRRVTLTPSKTSASEQNVVIFGDRPSANTSSKIVQPDGYSERPLENSMKFDKSDSDLSEAKRKERTLVYNLAEIYTVILNEVLISNMATELQLLLSMIKSPSTKAVSYITSHRIYFISTVLKGLDVWTRHLSPALLVELEKHVNISVTRVNPPLPLFAYDISIASVPFQIDEDTRPQFPNDRVFHVFKRIRDTFHSLLRDWEEGHSSSHSWSTEQVLGERMKSLLNQKLQLAIFTHFSKLFISLLLKKYKSDLCEMKSNSTEKLKKLQTRLSESDKVSSKICGPATFPKSQDFFKTFIVVSQNYSLNKHLTDHLIGKIALLDKQTKSLFTDSIDLDQSDLQEDFSWNLLSVQLLGKFLGLVWYMPYYTTQKIPPTVLTTLRETRTEPFPLDLDWYLDQSIADGTLTLTLPWVCELLVMMDAVCATLKRSKIVLAAVNNLYNQLSSLPIRQENKVMLLFKLGRVTELLLVPHGLYSSDSTSSFDYEPTLDALPLLNSTLLYACCPWLSTLQQVILKQPLSDSLPSTPTKISLVTTDNRTLLQLRENFFHHQPHTVRKVCEFVCERVHSNSLLELQARLVPMVKDETGSEIKTWINDQDPKELLEYSLNSRLQFFLGSLVCKCCEGVKEKCMELVLEFCQTACDRLMKDLLPANTESSVVAVATRLTVGKARGKCAIWWNTMAMSFVEREVQQISDIHIKHVLSEVRNLEVEECELRSLKGCVSDILLDRESEDGCCFDDSGKISEGKIERLMKLVKDTVINKENTSLFQNVADSTVDVLIEYISNPSTTLKCDLSRGEQLGDFSNTESVTPILEPKTPIVSKLPKLDGTVDLPKLDGTVDLPKLYGTVDLLKLDVTVDLLDPTTHLLLLLRDKKGVEIPLTKLPSQVSHNLLTRNVKNVNCDNTSSEDRFIEICLKLIYIGVLSPPRLEHWLLWLLETSDKESKCKVVAMATRMMDKYFELKAGVLKGKVRYVPRVAYFLKQYIVSDFEILRNTLNRNSL